MKTGSGALSAAVIQSELSFAFCSVVFILNKNQRGTHVGAKSYSLCWQFIPATAQQTATLHLK
jgi:hypothetical protein